MKKETTRKSSRTLKAQLFSAIAMMMVAAISLGASTYAWFVNNSTATVETMQFQASTARSLQVAVVKALTTGGEDGKLHATPTAEAGHTPFKNVITNTDITALPSAAPSGADWTNMFSADNKYLMQPSSTTDTKAFFTSDGGSMDKGTGKLDKFKAAVPGVLEVKRIPLVFNSSDAMKVYFDGKTAGTLAAADIVKEIKAGATTGDAAKIMKALRIAIVDTAKTTIFQFDEVAAATSGNNTHYGTATGTATEDGATGKYKAIVTVDTTNADETKKGLIATYGQQTAVLSSKITDYAATVASDGTTTATGKTELFTLAANTPKQVDVYMWLEGTDPDCLNAMSAAKFAVDLGFAGVVAP